MTSTQSNAQTNQRQRSIDRATAKAHEQALIGNLPRLLRQRDEPTQTVQVWAVGSRTTGGAVYTIDARTDADGTTTLCSCAAAESDRICWHRAAVRLAILGQIEYRDSRRAVAPVSAYALSGKPEPEPTEADFCNFDIAAG